MLKGQSGCGRQAQTGVIPDCKLAVHPGHSWMCLPNNKKLLKAIHDLMTKNFISTEKMLFSYLCLFISA